VFDGATNRTAIFIGQKQHNPFAYPVPYELWFGPSRLKQDLTLEEVNAAVTRLHVSASPVLGSKLSSPWLTVPNAALPALKKVTGPSGYQGRAGCTTWMNGIYWVTVIKSGPKITLIQNINDVGKTKGIKQVEMSVDTSLVFPLLRGRDVSRWSASPSCHIVMTQDAATRTPIAESVMKSRYAKTYAYLLQFKDKLKSRSGYKRYFARKAGGAPFYALYNVGPYTLAPWKVLWPEVGHSVRSGVVGPSDDKPAIPDHTLIFVGCTTELEAHFICAILNSVPVDLLVRGYIALHPSPHVLETAKVPRFNAENAQHLEIAELSKQAHRAVQKNDVVALMNMETSLQPAVSKLFGITAGELRACTSALSELGGSGGEEEPSDEAED
jgi:hypothetical protein